MIVTLGETLRDQDLEDEEGILLDDIKRELLLEQDQMSLAPSQIPSVVPTEILAAEYKKLMDEYNMVTDGNKRLEDEIEGLKAE
jgi:hypothetical protein